MHLGVTHIFLLSLMHILGNALKASGDLSVIRVVIVRSFHNLVFQSKTALIAKLVPGDIWLIDLVSENWSSRGLQA